MAKYCLIKSLAANFKKKLYNGEIDPEKLASMSSAERRSFLEKIVGKKDAANVNALFEKKMLQKNKWNAYMNWAKEITGIKPEIKRDLLSRIERMSQDTKFNILDPLDEKSFLNDLVNAKLGMGVTLEESKNIAKLSRKLLEAKRDKNNKLYGATQAALERYIGDIKVRDVSSWSWNPFKMVEKIAGNAKSIKASLDNSFALRQGLKTLWTHPVIWGKNFLKSWKYLVKGLGGNKNDVMDGIKAEIYSRENSINGNYKKMKIDLGGVEEAYPETFGEKIPLFKRLFIASEVAYNGMGMRLRADLADRFIDMATKQGIDLGELAGEKLTQGEAIGRFVNSMTGRGHLGELEKIGKHVNVLFFSPKFLASHIQTLTQPFTGAGGSNFVRKEAAKNLLKIVGGTAAVLFMADRLWPGSVDWDSRSSNFGKIKIGNTRFDVTGGMGSLITLASRLIPTKNEGKWGMWSKSSNTNQFTQIKRGFGMKDGMDVLYDFMENKFSPSASLVKDLLKQSDFEGNPLTLKGEAENLFVPMPIANAIENYKDPNAAPFLLSVIADGLGISTNTYSATTNWNMNTGKQLNQFKEKVGQEKFDEVNKEYNQIVGEKMLKLNQNDKYKNLSEEDKDKVITKMKANVKDDLYKKYKFKYKQEKTKKSDLKNINKLAK
jgi:hypothetical protein